ncbi:hypothetical protein QZH41_000508 [Actinostola sp. cb2023]|nr:hypothetical protein QZH41_000508 [Actinostola sp. cb2023]
MGNTQGAKLRDGKSESSSTLEFETGKKTFPSEEEAKMALEGEEENTTNLITKEEPSDFDFDLDEDSLETEPPKKMTIPTVFQWVNGGQDILLSGSFNEWKTRIPMNYSQHEFTAIIELPEGEHEYKFCVDGKWIHDPNLPTTNDNFGGRNNVISVRKTDMDVFDALDMDANASIGSGSVRWGDGIERNTSIQREVCQYSAV